MIPTLLESGILAFLFSEVLGFVEQDSPSSLKNPLKRKILDVSINDVFIIIKQIKISMISIFTL